MNEPYWYGYIDTAKATYSPNEVNIHNTMLYEYYRKYLMEKIISVYDWKLPESWSRNYFLYVLYCWGFLAVVKTDLYGVIPQQCSLAGYDVFHQPTQAIIANPRLTGILEPEIGTQCELIKLQPNFGSALDIVNYYAEQMTLVSEALSTNVINSKLAYVFAAESKSAAESFKRLYDNISAGEPAVFTDKKLFNEDGRPAWFTFANSLKENYIGAELLLDLQKLEYRFDTVVGIPNANTDKRERLITDEVNANNAETKAISKVWLESLQDGVERVRKMFGIPESEFSVKRAETEEPEEPEEPEVEENDRS